MALSEFEKFKILAVGSACVAILALIIALFFFMQNSAQTAELSRLRAENARLQAQNEQLQMGLASAQLQAQTCLQGGISSMFQGGIPLQQGNATITPEMIQALIQSMQGGNNSLQIPTRFQ